MLQFFPGTDAEKARLVAPHRIIGVTADVDDGHVVPGPTLTVVAELEVGSITRLHLGHTASSDARTFSRLIFRELGMVRAVERRRKFPPKTCSLSRVDRRRSLRRNKCAQRIYLNPQMPLY